MVKPEAAAEGPQVPSNPAAVVAARLSLSGLRRFGQLG